jgi:ferrochelatase
MYVDSWVLNYQKYAKHKPFDHIVFSFHGLPERQIRKSDPSASHCLSGQDCCANPSKEVLQRCYRAQCFASAHAIATQLQLRKDQYSVSFQSRLGRTPWIKPYTTELLQQLREQGKKNVHVFCPAFVADCLETLEEVGIGLREDWQHHGGEELLLIPSLNDENHWVENFAKWILKMDFLQV